nr:MFS transporter [Clostridium felsineum]
MMNRVKRNNSHSKWTILFVVVLMSFLSCVSSSIVNIALPKMAKQLSISMAEVTWIVSSYIMVICASLLIFGKLGDIKGKAKIFKIGTLIFTLASLMCGFSNSLTMLIIFRIIQGIGAGAYMANNQGIITQIFPVEERGKALGILASAVALGTMLGAPVGGLIINSFSWNYLFFVNVPIGIIAFAAGLRVLPKGKKDCKKLDIKGGILYFIASLLLFGALNAAQNFGFGNVILMVSLIISIFLFIIFGILEIKTENPLLELKIFKNNIFSLSLFCALVSFACIQASTIIIPFYLQDTLKMSASIAGIFLMLQPIIIAVISPVAGNLADKIGSEILTFLGLVLMACGFLFMSFLNESSSLIIVVFYMVIIALGQGLFQPANNSLIMSSAPRNKLGVVGSINSLVRNIGQIIGIILSGTILYDFMSLKLGYRVTDYVFGRDNVFVYGMKYVYIVLVCMCFIGMFFTGFRMYRKKHCM